MIVAYSVCQRDEANALRTLQWAYTLDGALDYDCVLSLGSGVERNGIVAAAQTLFRNVIVLDSNAPEMWPQGKNATFQNVVRYLDSANIRESFFWWEPDAIPLRKGWLNVIEHAHKEGGQPFTGYVNDAIGFMECVGVYPPNFMEYSPTKGMLCRAAPWDRCCGADILPQVHRANHLMHFVHDVDGFAPSFRDGALRLEQINPSAVLFHKNKDGTLVEQLSKGKLHRFVEGFFPPQRRRDTEPTEKIVVVMPVCGKDIGQAIVHAQWLKKLGGSSNHRAIVAHDTECPVERVNEFYAVCEEVFQTVQRLVYPVSPITSYPAVANWAFARVAEFMARGTAPWLWLEADCCVLRRDWLETLQKEYEAGGKRFMGPIVKESGFGHANGTSVYPADAVTRIPRALVASGVAWDFAMKAEMIGDCHDASHIIQNIWGMVNTTNGDVLGSETNGAVPPGNFTPDLARRLIRPNAVLLHRVKDTSLTELLMAGGWR